jgi:hypothetical protein
MRIMSSGLIEWFESVRQSPRIFAAVAARKSRAIVNSELDFKLRPSPEAGGALQEIHPCESVRQSFWHVRS